MEQVLHWIGFGLCHQLPERSFFGGGLQVPVCARDVGIYVGFVVALALLSVATPSRPTRAPSLPLMLLLLVFLGAMAVDGVSSYAGWRTTTNELRLATGLLAGFALAAVTMPLIHGQVWRRAGSGRVLGDASQRRAFFVGLPVTYAVVWWVAPLSGVVYPFLVALAVVITFLAVNLVAVCLLQPFERAYDSLADAWPALGVAAALALVEIGLSAWLKVVLLRIAQSVA